MLFVNGYMTCSGHLECTETLEKVGMSNFALRTSGLGYLSCPVSATSHTDETVEIHLAETPLRVDNTWQYYFALGSSYFAISSSNLIRFSSGFMEVRIDGVLQSYVANVTPYAGSGLDDLEGKMLEVKLGGSNSTTELVIGANDSYADRVSMLLTKVVMRDSGLTAVRDWDVDSSSIGTGVPIVTELLGGFDATGVNLPTDGTAWVDITPIGSLLNMTVLGAGNDTLTFEFYDRATKLHVKDEAVVFSSDAGVVNFSLAVGSVIGGFHDGGAPPTTGTGFYGVTE